MKQHGKGGVAVEDIPGTDPVRKNPVTLFRVKSIGEPCKPMVESNVDGSIPLGIIVLLPHDIPHIGAIVFSQPGQVGIDTQVPVVISNPIVIEMVIFMEARTEGFAIASEGSEPAIF
jgi:hypothetical protein